MSSLEPRQLKIARVNADLTREHVAIHIGKGYRTVQGYETGQVIPPGNVLVMLADLYNVPVDDFLRHDETPAGAR